MTVSSTLPQVLGTYTPEPRPPRKRQYRGYSIDPRRTSETLLTDHQVREARWLSQYGGWTHAMVRDHFGLTYQYTNRLLDYVVRSKVYVREGDFPPGHKPGTATN